MPQIKLTKATGAEPPGVAETIFLHSEEIRGMERGTQGTWVNLILGDTLLIFETPEEIQRKIKNASRQKSLLIPIAVAVIGGIILVIISAVRAWLAPPSKNPNVIFVTNSAPPIRPGVTSSIATKP